MENGTTGNGPDWSTIPQLVLWSVVEHLDDPSDLSALRLACRRWSKTVTQNAKTWRVRGPVARFHWNYLRGTLYTLCPVADSMTVLLSNRVAREALEAMFADLNWWSRLRDVTLVSLRPTGARGLFGPGLPAEALAGVSALRGLQALTTEGCEPSVALHAAMRCTQLTRLAVRSRRSPLSGGPSRVNNGFLEHLADSQRAISKGQPPPPPPPGRRGRRGGAAGQDANGGGGGGGGAGGGGAGGDGGDAPSGASDDGGGGGSGQGQRPEVQELDPALNLELQQLFAEEEEDSDEEEATKAAAGSGGGGADADVEMADAGADWEQASARQRRNRLAVARMRLRGAPAGSINSGGGGGGGSAAGVSGSGGSNNGPPYGGLRFLELDADAHMDDAASVMSLLEPQSASLALRPERIHALLAALPSLEHLDMRRVPLDETAVLEPLATLTRLTELRAAVQDGSGGGRVLPQALRVLNALARPTGPHQAFRPPPPPPQRHQRPGGDGDASTAPGRPYSASDIEPYGPSMIPGLRTAADAQLQQPYGPPPGPGRPVLHLYVTGANSETPNALLTAMLPLVPRLRTLYFSHAKLHPGHMPLLGHLTSLDCLALALSHSGAAVRRLPPSPRAAARMRYGMLAARHRHLARLFGHERADARDRLEARYRTYRAIERAAALAAARDRDRGQRPGADAGPGLPLDPDSDMDFELDSLMFALEGEGRGGLEPPLGFGSGDELDDDGDGDGDRETLAAATGAAGGGLGLAGLARLVRLQELHVRGPLKPVGRAARVAAGLAALATHEPARLSVRRAWPRPPLAPHASRPPLRPRSEVSEWLAESGLLAHRAGLSSGAGRTTASAAADASAPLVSSSDSAGAGGAGSEQGTVPAAGRPQDDDGGGKGSRPWCFRLPIPSLYRTQRPQPAALTTAGAPASGAPSAGAAAPAVSTAAAAGAPTALQHPGARPTGDGPPSGEAAPAARPQDGSPQPAATSVPSAAPLLQPLQPVEVPLACASVPSLATTSGTSAGDAAGEMLNLTADLPLPPFPSLPSTPPYAPRRFASPRNASPEMQALAAALALAAAEWEGPDGDGAAAEAAAMLAAAAAEDGGWPPGRRYPGPEGMVHDDEFAAMLGGHPFHHNPGGGRLGARGGGRAGGRGRGNGAANGAAAPAEGGGGGGRGRGHGGAGPGVVPGGAGGGPGGLPLPRAALRFPGFNRSPLVAQNLDLLMQYEQLMAQERQHQQQHQQHQHQHPHEPPDAQQQRKRSHTFQRPQPGPQQPGGAGERGVWSAASSGRAGAPAGADGPAGGGHVPPRGNGGGGGGGEAEGAGASGSGGGGGGGLGSGAEPRGGAGRGHGRGRRAAGFLAGWQSVFGALLGSEGGGGPGGWGSDTEEETVESSGDTSVATDWDARSRGVSLDRMDVDMPPSAVPDAARRERHQEEEGEERKQRGSGPAGQTEAVVTSGAGGAAGAAGAQATAAVTAVAPVPTGSPPQPQRPPAAAPFVPPPPPANQPPNPPNQLPNAAHALEDLARDRQMLRRAVLSLLPADVSALRTHGSRLEVLSLHYVRMPPDVLTQLKTALPRLRRLSLRWANDHEALPALCGGRAAVLAGACGAYDDYEGEYHQDCIDCCYAGDDCDPCYGDDDDYGAYGAYGRAWRQGGGRVDVPDLPQQLESLELGGPVTLRVTAADLGGPSGSSSAPAPMWTGLRRLVLTDSIALPAGTLPALLAHAPRLTELQLVRPRRLQPKDLGSLEHMERLRTLVLDVDSSDVMPRRVRLDMARGISHLRGLTELQELRWNVPDPASKGRREGCPSGPSARTDMEAALLSQLSALTGLQRLSLLSLPSCRHQLQRTEDMQALRHLPFLELC